LQELDAVHAEHGSFPAELLLQHVRVPALEYLEPTKQLRRLIQDPSEEVNWCESFGTAVDNLEMCFPMRLLLTITRTECDLEIISSWHGCTC
jgi:hypothetical protein